MLSKAQRNLLVAKTQQVLEPLVVRGSQLHGPGQPEQSTAKVGLQTVFPFLADLDGSISGQQGLMAARLFQRRLGASPLQTNRRGDD